MRANQGTLQLQQIVRREANVRAYNDVFMLTAAIALLYLLWSLGASARVRQAAALVRAMTRQSGNQVAAAAATDGTPSVRQRWRPSPRRAVSLSRSMRKSV